MRVAVYYNNRDVRIEEIAKPTIDDDEILLKVMASGICGSDVTEWYRLPNAPRVLGHEAAGIIEKVGKRVKSFFVGDRVFVSHHVPCNKCRYCLRGQHTACETLHTTNYYPGGFSEFIKVPKINAEEGTYKLPPDMSFDEATFIEPLACVVRGQRLAGIRKDDTMLVFGAGVSGLLHVKLARLRGVRKIIAVDINPQRLKYAEQFGAHRTIDARENVSEKLKEMNDCRLANQTIVCTGSTQAALTGLECLDKGGTILFFAVPPPAVKISIPITQFWRNEITVKTSYGAAPGDLEEALSILSKKEILVKDMITNRLTLDETPEGFRLMAEADKSLKVIIEPNRPNLT
ncbi:TPA: alcohol dehydrogenase catalytic domain-containing protein [Candidatus Bathyarchaeota archaeon]|nr:alcohol dehydrogenase catalytic domain-containing protein [Candidatus Bathyarchaeota archaeon]HIJ08906.1 alcohol dehydrogenase catalytic domain-containing protein [Candidatus Bathyarchaeota archaeon]